MPGRDGTGPFGQGAFTGRGLGNCLTYGIPAIAGAMAAFGLGRRRGWFGRGAGRGAGLGWRNFVPEAGVAPGVDEVSALKDQKKFLEESLKSIRERLSEIDQK